MTQNLEPLAKQLLKKSFGKLKLILRRVGEAVWPGIVADSSAHPQRDISVQQPHEEPIDSLAPRKYHAIQSNAATVVAREIRQHLDRRLKSAAGRS